MTMWKVVLQTERGELVQEGWMPAFVNGSPAVVNWGTRTFVFYETRLTDAPTFIYRERFTWTLVEVKLAEPPPVDRSKVSTLHGATPEQVRAQHATQPEGQHPDYIVLNDEERAKGFVRPVRQSYRHVGTPAPKYALADLDSEQSERYKERSYVKFEKYPDDHPLHGRYWTQAQLDAVGKGCGQVTSMGSALSETYARDPKFYGATFCCQCNKHLPVGAEGEFVWDGTDERVGT
jgi:hypothetical protein